MIKNMSRNRSKIIRSRGKNRRKVDGRTKGRTGVIAGSSSAEQEHYKGKNSTKAGL